MTRFKGILLVVLAFPVGACGDKNPMALSEASPSADSTPNPPGTDSAIPPPTPDSVVPPLPPTDSVTPPTDSLAPPTDSVIPPLPPPPPHVGIPFGTFRLPPEQYGMEVSAGHRLLHDEHPIEDLEAARRAGVRILIGLVGNERRYVDADGHFSLEAWKRRVDRFLGADFTPYIEDGTIIGHFILDEPQDRNNWNGEQVSLAEIDEMARYSKELWPSMATVIRVAPSYLKGYQFKYLDAAWAQYVERFGPIDEFIRTYVQDAKATGVALIGGMNLLGGGGPNGLKGYHSDKFAMTAAQLRTWGGAFLSEPYFCAFINWRYDAVYFSRPDIKAALADLAEEAKTYPMKTCRVR